MLGKTPKENFQIVEGEERVPVVEHLVRDDIEMLVCIMIFFVKSKLSFFWFVSAKVMA